MTLKIILATIASLALVAGAAWAAVAREGDSVGGGGTAELDGMVVATEGGLEGGRLWVLWDGGRQRIYQPRPLALADLDALGLRIGAPLDRVVVAEEPTGSYFAVYPADGDAADLYLVTGAEMHRVHVEEADADAVLARAQIDPTFMDRLRGAKR